MRKLNRHLRNSISLAVLVCCSLSAHSETIRVAPQDGDMTLVIRDALESAKGSEVKIVLEKGVYNVTPEYAYEKYCAVTNHNNGTKRIVFPINGFESVEIEGNGATIICDGQLFPFLFENCQSVSVCDLTIDWKRPFLFYGEVVAVNEFEQWRDIKPLCDPDSWSIEGGHIVFPHSHGFNFYSFGATLPFDAETKNVVCGAIDHNSGVDARVELLNNGNVRIYEKMKQYPPVGSILNSKGDKQLNRYSPAFDFKECQDIVIDNITIHHALGMGFLFERSENIKILNSKIVLPPNSKRVVSSIADATHFANCRGDILIENCLFENMLDDGTNVHGTYVEVVDIIDEYSINVALQHYQQMGFKFAEVGDEMWFIQQPSPARTAPNRVNNVRILNERMLTLTFDDPLPETLQKGDCVENKSWNPTFTMRGSVVRNHRARGVVLKTPLKTIIEYNTFSSMMSAILFRGETYSWFESGAVEDVLIQNNTIKNSAICGGTHAALYITPRLGDHFDDADIYDKNIRFINNKIDCFNPRVVIADRVEGLVVSGNKIVRNNDAVAISPNAPLFELKNCENSVIESNVYNGVKPIEVLRSDKRSNETLKIRKNKNLEF